MTRKPPTRLPVAPRLPGLPPDLVAEQAAHWARLDPEQAPAMRALLDTIMEVRTAHAERSGWLPAQVGYLTIKVSPRPLRRNDRAFTHVLLSDRDLDTGACVAGLNTRIFCFVNRDTGGIFKISQGKVLADARGSIFDADSVRRAVTPFGIQSR